MAYFAAPESTNKRIVSDDSHKIKVACDKKLIWGMDEYERVEQPPVLTGCSLKACRSANSSTDKTKRMSKPK
jgi:hypothetical protein